MAFNDLRLMLAMSARDSLGEPATYRPKAGGEITTTVIVHRDRSAMGDRDRQYLGTSMTTVTVFRVGDDGDVALTKTGDEIELASGEKFEVSGSPEKKDEYKTIVPVTPSSP